MSGNARPRKQWRAARLALAWLAALTLIQSGPSAGVINLNAGANAQIVIINGQPALMNKAVEPDLTVRATGDLLRLTDGSELHGALAGIAPGQSVAWSHPDSTNPITLGAGTVDLIRFANAKTVPLTPKNIIRFVNGDEIPADITSLGWDKIGVNTWFSGPAAVARASVQSITFLPKGYTSSFEGPLGPQGWLVTPPNTWRYRDGVFTGRGSGSLGCDPRLAGSSTIEFDLASSAPYHLYIGLYLQQDQISFGAGSYVIDLSPGLVNVHRGTQPGGLTDLGTGSLPALTRKGRIHFTIQCNQADKSLTILADGKLVRRWQDDIGFVDNGSRVVFSDISQAPGLSVGNFRVSQWEGREPDVISAPQTNYDSLWLINHDRAVGKITGLSGGDVTFQLSGHEIKIPMSRITKIEFAAVEPVAPRPGEVRALLPGGTRLLVELDKWTPTEIAARSPCLGALNIKPGMIRELDFDPGGAKPEAATAIDEFGGLDE